VDTNITIIGAGVVGLAIARELALYYDEIYVIEKNSKFGQETSSRNSEVIHSGIYYPKNSLKAKLCVEGRKLLYQYCEENIITHRKCGKLVVATNDSEDNEIKEILNKSRDNGVEDGRYLNKKETIDLEPNINAQSSILFPSTGIIDSYGLMKQLETDATNEGVKFVYNSEVVNIKKIQKGYSVTIKDNAGEYSFTSNTIINSAGLYSDKIAKIAGAFEPGYELHYWKGEYFSVGNGKNKLITHLIYPTPHQNNIGLGIHATLDINNRLRLGPNAIFLGDKILNYKVDVNNKEKFYNAVKTILPFIEIDDLMADQVGIRPKLQKPDDAVKDFIIKNEEEKGFPNFINLIGIESPGLTSCMAIAKLVKGKMK
jgi:L-2-hydroxyglutarate oxidase LhgO